MATEGEFSGKYAVSIVSADENGTKKITVIYLDEPLRKISDYADIIDFENKTVERKITRFDLTSDLDWIKVAVNPQGYARFRLALPYSFAEETRKSAMTNRFRVTVEDLNHTAQPSVNLYNGHINVFLPNSEISTVSEFKKWLDDNPTYIEYVLAEPTTETINLPEIPTFDGTTIITTDTEIQPSNIEITYKARK